MTTYTLKDGFQSVRDRLKTIAQAAVTLSVGTLDYVVPQADVNPHIEFIVMRTTRQKLSSSQQTFTSNWRMTIYIAGVQESYDGQWQEDAQFDILPTALEYFEAHSSMKATAADSSPPYFDPINSGITAASIQIIDKQLCIVLDWNIVFITSIQRC